MKALIILAHGSRRETSALEILKLAEDLEKMAAGQFAFVRSAFIQFCSPSFHEVVDMLIDREIQEIVVLPYLISAGNHVVQDIPELIAASRVRYPDLTFRVTDHFGKFYGLKKLIIEEAGKV